MPEIPVPQEVRDAVLQELYRQVESLDWDKTPAREKTRYYTRWVEDPAIGGELADYYTAEGMRVWLKDGPLKEYSRALEGVGPYAKYITMRLSPPDEFIPRLLGGRWGLVPDSLGEKPMNCRVTDGTEQRYVCWGNPRTFRDLLWAAVNMAIEGDARPLIVVSSSDERQVEPAQAHRQQRLAEHCGVDLAYVRRRREDRPPE